MAVRKGVIQDALPEDEESLEERADQVISTYPTALDWLREQRPRLMNTQDALCPDNPYHAHLNVCSQCESRPWNLCPVGADLLEKAVRSE